MIRTSEFGVPFALRLCLIALLASLILPENKCAAKADAIDEISITINIQKIGAHEITALIKNEEIYLPVGDLFDILKIKNTTSADLNLITGSIIDPKILYTIDKLKNQIVYQEKQFTLKPEDIIRSETDLYLKAAYFGMVFGLDCHFNYRSLSVSLTTKLELPAIREIKLQQMRKNLGALKGEKVADTTAGKSLHFYDLGTADWAITTAQDNLGNRNLRANMVLGAVLAGGEVTANLVYDSNRAISLEEQAFQWRFINNDRAGLRQITAGRIYTQTTASLFGTVNGIQLTNMPTTYRRSFGTYRISDTTEPGWIVELYVNDILVDYVKADASGIYGFDVPLVYGNSSIKTRVYGPWGEVYTNEQNIIIPFNLLPSGQLEYSFSAGVVNDTHNSILTKASFNYGLNDRITVGSGAEYVSSVNAGVPMPFLNSSIRVNSALLFSGQFSPGVSTQGSLNYSFPKNMQLNLNYTRYAKEQTAIIYNYLEERKIELSVPIRGKQFNAYSRLSFNQFVLSGSKVTNAQVLLSAFVTGVNTSFSTNVLYTDPAHPYIYSNLSLSFRMPMAFRFTPRIQYEFKKQKISAVKAELERQFGRMGFATLTYERNAPSKLRSITLGLRLNLSAAQTYFSVTHSNYSTSSVQSGSGSLLYNNNTQKLSLSKERNTGRGGLTILPYLDLNNDGKHNANEPRAFGLKVKVPGGRIMPNDRDTTIDIRGLQAYTNYTIELDSNSFDNISWRLKKKTIGVTIEPNHDRLIEVPVSVVSEVSGYVYLTDVEGRKGQGLIVVDLLNDQSQLITSIMTEPDGYFSYIGLLPGRYVARINYTQIRKLNLQPVSDIFFHIGVNTEGDIIDGLEFNLRDGSSDLKKKKWNNLDN